MTNKVAVFFPNIPTLLFVQFVIIVTSVIFIASVQLNFPPISHVTIELFSSGVAIKDKQIFFSLQTMAGVVSLALKLRHD